MNLLPHQQNHAAHLVAAIKEHRAALDASDPGTGKTYVACAVAAKLGLPVVIITPKATVPSWEAVAAGFGVRTLLVTNYEKIRTGRMSECRRFGGCYTWHLPDSALIIFDECQKCKGRDSLNAKMLIAARRQHFRILLCSATAASNPLEMRAIGFTLGLHSLHDFYSWARRHGVVDGLYGLEYKGKPEYMAAIHNAIFPRRGHRMRIADIKDFPDTIIESALIETGKAKAIQREYDRLRAELRKAERAGDDDTLQTIADKTSARRANAMTITLRARQAIELYKVDAMVELARNAAEEGMSVVLLVNFTATSIALAEKLDCSHIISGGQSDAERQAHIEAFQANRAPFIIVNIQAGGAGISLHDPQGIRPRLSIISPTFSATDLKQALGRVHRSGGAASIQKICFAAGTCEEHTARACAEKLANIDLLNDGDMQPFPIALH